jgi:hypothetical protein
MKKTYFCIIKDSPSLDGRQINSYYYNEDGKTSYEIWCRREPPPINLVYLAVESVNEAFEELKEKIKRGEIVLSKNERIRKAEIEL